MPRWLSLAWRVVATASVIHWLVSGSSAIVFAIITTILAAVADLPVASTIASGIIIFVLVFLLTFIALPIWHTRRLRGDLQNLAGALEYDLGYIRNGQKPPHVETGRWAQIHRRLAKIEGLEKTYRATERAFQEVNLLREDVVEVGAVAPTIEEALSEIDESLSQLSGRDVARTPPAL